VLSGAGSKVANAGRYVRMAPLTVAVAGGPLIDVVEGLTRSGIGQIARGILTLTMLLAIRKGRTFTRRSRVLLPLFALGFYGFVRAASLDYAFDGAVLGFKLLFLAAVYLSTRELVIDGHVTASWVLGVAWVALLTVLASQVAGRGLGVASVYAGEGGFPGLTGQPAMIAASACALLALFAVRSPLRWTDLVGIALCVGSIAATQRRSSAAAALAALMVFGVFTVRSAKRRAALRLATLFVLLAIVVYALATMTSVEVEFAERFEDLNFREGGTASGRTEFQRIAIAHVLARELPEMLFGEGPRALQQVLGQEFGIAIGGHNDWIDVVYGLGLVGLALFLWFYVNLTGAARRLEPQWRGVAMMSLVGSFILGATTGGALDPTAAPMFAIFGFLGAREETATRNRGVRRNLLASAPPLRRGPFVERGSRGSV
jgi:O-antigen ligase